MGGLQLCLRDSTAANSSDAFLQQHSVSHCSDLAIAPVPMRSRTLPRPAISRCIGNLPKLIFQLACDIDVSWIAAPKAARILPTMFTQVSLGWPGACRMSQRRGK